MDSAVSTDSTYICSATVVSLKQPAPFESTTRAKQQRGRHSTLNKNGSLSPNLFRTPGPSACGCCSSQLCKLVVGSAASMAGPLGCVPILQPVNTSSAKADNAFSDTTDRNPGSKWFTYQSSAYGFSWSTFVPAAAVSAATCKSLPAQSVKQT